MIRQAIGETTVAESFHSMAPGPWVQRPGHHNFWGHHDFETLRIFRQQLLQQDQAAAAGK
jgi:hypothetical protein